MASTYSQDDLILLKTDFPRMFNALQRAREQGEVYGKKAASIQSEEENEDNRVVVYDKNIAWWDGGETKEVKKAGFGTPQDYLNIRKGVEEPTEFIKRILERGPILIEEGYPCDFVSERASNYIEYLYKWCDNIEIRSSLERGVRIAVEGMMGAIQEGIALPSLEEISIEKVRPEIANSSEFTKKGHKYRTFDFDTNIIERGGFDPYFAEDRKMVKALLYDIVHQPQKRIALLSRDAKVFALLNSTADNFMRWKEYELRRTQVLASNSLLVGGTEALRAVEEMQSFPNRKGPELLQLENIIESGFVNDTWDKAYTVQHFFFRECVNPFRHALSIMLEKAKISLDWAEIYTKTTNIKHRRILAQALSHTVPELKTTIQEIFITLEEGKEWFKPFALIYKQDLPFYEELLSSCRQVRQAGFILQHLIQESSGGFAKNKLAEDYKKLLDPMLPRPLEFDVDDYWFVKKRDDRTLKRTKI